MNNLKRIRGEMCLTQDEFAKKLGTTRELVTYYEKKLSVAKAIEIANKLKCNVFDLLGTDVLKVMPTTKQDIDYLMENLSRRFKDVWNKD